MMSIHKKNCEERRFGFLFMAALLSNKKFRLSIFKAISQKQHVHLDANNFGVYAEVPLFRDYWRRLGNLKTHTEKLCAKRQTTVEKILKAMKVDPAVLETQDGFWTGTNGSRKLRFPGRWPLAEIEQAEDAFKIHDNALKRCRWMCNAKPDLMLESAGQVIFIEIKLENGMGLNRYGYKQEETLTDIITVAPHIFDWMQETKPIRLNLTKNSANGDLTWQEIRHLHTESKMPRHLGYELIERHFEHIPA